MEADDQEDDWTYEVVINHEEQYSIWAEFKGSPPPGWRTVGKRGLKPQCLEYIKTVWTDMRPLSLRKEMEEAERRRPKLEREHAKRLEELAKLPKDPRDDLVGYLSEGDHPVEVRLRPERTCKHFKEALDRGYVHIAFTDTRGATELGVRLDREASDTRGADFDEQTGQVLLEGNLVLNYVPLVLQAKVRLNDLRGTGKLVLHHNAAGAHAAVGSAST
jgi:uncharacterized protein YbdZ (MbtH family)